MKHQIFISLPVSNLRKSINYFTKIGYTFNPQFTDKNATCMIIDEKQGIFVMLLVRKFFKTFTDKKIADAKKTAQMQIGLSVDSRANVNAWANKALKAGGKEPRPKQDLGYMFSRDIEDLDGHVWGIFHMDMKKFPKPPKKK